ncbi:uncharacterized protein ACNLHF_002105 [Anomaloglossus baeobatrachus]
MAFHFQFSPNYAGDIWREETLPGFQEVILSSNDLPKDGKIYVMYHGTTYSAAKDIIKTGFRQSSDGMLGRGVYVSRDMNKALRYPLNNQTDQVVLKLRVNVGKVKKIDYQGHPMQKTWHDNGYDTAWVPAFCGAVKSGLEEDCIWDPERIKVVGIAKAPPKYQQELELIMANQYGDSSNDFGDIWKEEHMPGFEELILHSNDLPQDGKIYVMYHGTTFSAAQKILEDGFAQSPPSGMLGSGVYVSRDINKALRYPLYDKSEQVVLKLRVSVGRVKKIEHQGHPMQKTWNEHGYDTAWVPPNCGMVRSGLEEDCVWDPRRIKVMDIAKASPELQEQLNYFFVTKQNVANENDESEEIYGIDENGEIYEGEEFYEDGEGGEFYEGGEGGDFYEGEGGEGEEFYEDGEVEEFYEGEGGEGEEFYEDGEVEEFYEGEGGEGEEFCEGGEGEEFYEGEDGEGEEFYEGEGGEGEEFYEGEDGEGEEFYEGGEREEFYEGEGGEGEEFYEGGCGEREEFYEGEGGEGEEFYEGGCGEREEFYEGEGGEGEEFYEGGEREEFYVGREGEEFYKGGEREEIHESDQGGEREESVEIDQVCRIYKIYEGSESEERYEDDENGEIYEYEENNEGDNCCCCLLM